ncbi:MAG: peptidoglycan-binding protein [Moorea sp. SIO2B7]|nr:peptidoglycan-binding protein [Moorena sp. SIO2B7]
MKGQDVIALQQALINKGFSPGSADGIFGSNTDTQVRNFQKNKGLVADGIVGPSTGRALGLLKV